MQSVLRLAVDKYCEEVNVKALPCVLTPSLDQDAPLTEQEAQRGKQAKTCASHLMKLLFAARMSCPWLLIMIKRWRSMLPVGNCSMIRLAEVDVFLSRNTHLKLRFQLSEADLQDCELHYWPDADQGGKHDSSKST